MTDTLTTNRKGRVHSLDSLVAAPWPLCRCPVLLLAIVVFPTRSVARLAGCVIIKCICGISDRNSALIRKACQTTKRENTRHGGSLLLRAWWFRWHARTRCGSHPLVRPVSDQPFCMHRTHTTRLNGRIADPTPDSIFNNRL